MKWLNDRISVNLLIGMVRWRMKQCKLGNNIVLFFRKYQQIIMCHLTHWGRVTHICVSDLTIIGSDNDLSPEWRQAIIGTNAEILLIWPLGTNFSEIIAIRIFSFKKMHLKMSSGKWRPSCLGLNRFAVHDSPPGTLHRMPLVSMPVLVYMLHIAQ